MPFPVPQDVLKWLRHVFFVCNSRVSTKITRIPTVHETFLDLSLIENLSQFQAPFMIPSGWLVELETHYLGGGRHFGQWEVADIGIIITLRQGGRFLFAKLALLQSKRLYPNEQSFQEDSPVDYVVGFGRLLRANSSSYSLGHTRKFTFSERSQYKTLKKGDNQFAKIEGYEKTFGIPVFYLLYNPRQIPSSTNFPVTASASSTKGKLAVGCRVLPSPVLRSSISSKPDNYSPAFLDLTSLGDPFDRKQNKGGWRLEDFVVDLLIGCKAGHGAKDENDVGLHTAFSRRDAPIAAAIGITIEAPEAAELNLED